MERDTGARALRAVMEEAMLDLMFDLPDLDARGVRYVIDADFIRGERAVNEILRVRKKESA